MAKYEILTIAVQGISIIFLALTVLYASLQLRSVQKINSQTHDWNRRNAAQEMCVRYSEFNPNKVLFLKELEYFQNKGSISLKEMEAKFEKNIELRNAAHTILNYFEYLCLGIKQGVYDEIVVREFWANTMNNVYLMLHSYVIQKRKDQPTIWVYVEEYANKWQHEKQATDSRVHVA